MTVTTAVVGFVNAATVCAAQFGASVSESQQAAITGLVNAAMLLGALLLAQRRRRLPVV